LFIIILIARPYLFYSTTIAASVCVWCAAEKPKTKTQKTQYKNAKWRIFSSFSSSLVVVVRSRRSSFVWVGLVSFLFLLLLLLFPLGFLSPFVSRWSFAVAGKVKWYYYGTTVVLVVCRMLLSIKSGTTTTAQHRRRARPSRANCTVHLVSSGERGGANDPQGRNRSSTTLPNFLRPLCPMPRSPSSSLLNQEREYVFFLFRTENQRRCEVVVSLCLTLRY
jgi:hypothetical protein